MEPRLAFAIQLIGAFTLVACGGDRSGLADNAATSAGNMRLESDQPSTSCEVTLPDGRFTPPSPFPQSPSPDGSRAWQGSSRLWTALAARGEVWSNLPHEADGLTQKTFWWSESFDWRSEPEPAISVSGRRLDGSGAFATSGKGTHALFDGGPAMLVGVRIPSIGCWELTGRYRDDSLTYTVEVR